jgi:hypothetical protein
MSVETIKHTVGEGENAKTLTEYFDPDGYYAMCDGQRFETLGEARRAARGLPNDPPNDPPKHTEAKLEAKPEETEGEKPDGDSNETSSG